MASAYSILRNYGDYIQPYDFDLIQKGLMYKQQKYDANAAYLQNQIDQFANIDLAKEEDKEYLNKRLNTLVSQVNEYGKMDLSSSGITRNISSHIGQALDENVMNAYMGTQALRKLQGEIEQVRKDNPEQYSSINAAYALKDGLAWVNDGQAGTSYKGGSYIPYRDVMGAKSEMMKEMYKNSKSSMTVPEYDANGQPTGRMITKEFQGLTDDEVASAFEGTLSPEEKKQLEINSWATYQQNPEQTMEIYNRYMDSRAAEIDKGLQLAQEKGDKDKIEFYSNLKDSFNNQKDKLGQNVASIGYYLEKENVMGGLKSQFRQRRINYEYKNDAAFWASRADARDNAKLQLEYKKFELEKQQAMATAMPNFDVVREGGELQDEVNREELFQQKIDESKGNTSRLANQLLNSTFKNEAALINEEVEAYVKQFPNATKDEALFDIINKRLTDNPDLVGQEVLNYKMAYKAYKGILEDEAELYNAVKTDLNEAIDSKMDIVFEDGNSNFRNKYNSVLPFELVPDSEYNSANKNQRRLSDLSETERLQVKRVMLADVINSKVADGDQDGLGYYVDMLAETFGETGSYDTDIAYNTMPVGTGGGRPLISYKVKAGRNTEQFLAKTRAAGIRNTPNIGFDNSIVEDADFRMLTQGDYISQRRNEMLGERLTDNVGRKVITVSPQIIKGMPKRTIQQQAVFTTIGQAMGDPTTQFVIDGDRIPINKMKQEYLEDIKLETDMTVGVTIDSGVQGMSRIELQDGTTMLVRTELVNSNFQKVGINADMESIDRDRVFLSTKRSSEENVRFLTQSQLNQQADFLTETLSDVPEALQTLTPRMTMITLKQKYPLSEAQNQNVQDILNQANNLKTSLNMNNGNIIFEVKKNNGEVVYSNRTPVQSFSSVQQAEKEYEKMVKTQAVAPQFLLYSMLDLIATDELTNEFPVYTFEEVKNSIYQ